ncbi:hypothetical protein D6T64_08795 [Cryobacterium melibiosiphilum]|uniref:Uncharacterized protein n=1 Tax=Cryobacterium melibiosiphilum TaxID=995039 RepID=A0A3A5MJ06_9MICO|nr:hypothetical protein D6T64_08795 [Cryobacterium melibiosiphilum]
METTDSSTNWTLNGWVWFALALVNAGLAEQKNRSRLAWFLGSILLGPIATALIVMMGRPTEAPAPTLHPFSDRADRYFSLAGVTSILTLGVIFLTFLGTTWYQLAGGVVAGIVGMTLSAVFVVRYYRVRSASRAQPHQIGSEPAAAASHAESEAPQG